MLELKLAFLDIVRVEFHAFNVLKIKGKFSANTQWIGRFVQVGHPPD